VLSRVFGNAFGAVKYDRQGWCPAGEAALDEKRFSATVPKKRGFEFVGWHTDKELTQINNPDRRDYADGIELTITELDGGGTIKRKLPKVTELYAKWRLKGE
jgi:hypothetical protein